MKIRHPDPDTENTILSAPCGTHGSNLNFYFEAKPEDIGSDFRLNPYWGMGTHKLSAHRALVKWENRCPDLGLGSLAPLQRGCFRRRPARSARASRWTYPARLSPSSRRALKLNFPYQALLCRPLLGEHTGYTAPPMCRWGSTFGPLTEFLFSLLSTALNGYPCIKAV